MPLSQPGDAMRYHNRLPFATAKPLTRQVTNNTDVIDAMVGPAAPPALV
jgi:hypothetical protein